MLIVVVAEARVQSRNPATLVALYDAIGKYNVEILFTTPAIIAAVGGRRYLKSVLLGKSRYSGRSWSASAWAACVLLSSIVGLAYFTWPSFDAHGFWDAFGALPITAYLLGPFREEMLYQVGLQTWLQRCGPIVAVLGATAPFWGYHVYGISLGALSWPDALFWLLPSFIAYAFVRQVTKSFGAAVLAHSTYNVLVSGLPLFPR